MNISRRQFVAGALAGVACGPRGDPLVGTIVGRSDAERGHSVPSGVLAPGGAVDVAIVGAGIGGLTAAWRLARAGFRGTVGIYELGDGPGGTSAGGPGFPWGAHYVTLPNPGARHYRALLADLGVITGYDGDGRPHFVDTAVCYAPQERVFDGQEWVEGLVPDTVDPAEQAELRDFEAACAAWSARLGADGLPAFEIPVARSSIDPELRALAGVSFADWLEAQGYRSRTVRWTTRYATRDDFGAEPRSISAWAGLHYFAARRPDPAVRDLATNILTWPDGNASLVDGLVRRIPWPITFGAVVHAVEADGDGVRIVVNQQEIRARTVIAAVPSRVVARWFPLDVVPDLAPWRIAALTVDTLPKSAGVPFAWDSVRRDGRGLGYVSNVHQTGAFRGPAVLTYYDPLSGTSPADGRRSLIGARWEDEAALVLDDLAPAHADLRAVTRRLDVRHWGHGTTIPAVGLHRTTGWHTSQPHPRVWLAHTDRSGMSLFEEASWHGVRSAEAALEVLGVPVGERLV